MIHSTMQSGAKGVNRQLFVVITLLSLALSPLGVHAEGAQATTVEDQRVERLQDILRAYYTDSEPPPRQSTEAAVDPNEPGTPEAVATKAADGEESKALPTAAFATDQVYLNGSQAAALLAQFTRRLDDPRIPDLHRDVAPICSVKTRLFDTLVDSERLSLKPVGKHHYVGSLKLQPGVSTFSIKSQQWNADIPPDGKAREHLITFYRYPGKKPQLHTFAIEELVAAGVTDAPAWLPPDITEQFSP